MASEHSAHVTAHNRGLVKPHRALDPRTCDACGETICCFYGQKSVEDEAAPVGVWLLHPWCEPPRRDHDGK